MNNIRLWLFGLLMKDFHEVMNLNRLTVASCNVADDDPFSAVSPHPVITHDNMSSLTSGKHAAFTRSLNTISFSRIISAMSFSFVDASYRWCRMILVAPIISSWSKSRGRKWLVYFTYNFLFTRLNKENVIRNKPHFWNHA